MIAVPDDPSAVDAAHVEEWHEQRDVLLALGRKLGLGADELDRIPSNETILDTIGREIRRQRWTIGRRRWEPSLAGPLYRTQTPRRDAEGAADAVP